MPAPAGVLAVGTSAVGTEALGAAAVVGAVVGAVMADTGDVGTATRSRARMSRNHLTLARPR